MPEHISAQRNRPKICLLGASFDTGNMGVSALAEASIKCILHRWPDAEVMLLAGGQVEQRRRLKLMGRDVWVREMTVRFSKNFLLPNHFCVMMLYALAMRLLPWRRVKDALAAGNNYCRAIVQTDLAADITGGDSFSDIYGVRRFILGLLYKVLFLQFGRELIMLPQTYGPFKRTTTRAAAKYVLKRASAVYSRDRAGVEYLRQLLKGHNSQGKIRFLPDVAFVLDSNQPEHLDVGTLPNTLRQESIVVGLNISGLLFNGGYTRDNMFGLKTDYRQLVYEIIELLLKHDRVAVLLVPHVFPPAGYEVESDPEACLQVFRETNEKYPGRIFLTRGEYNHNEIKYIIGLCDFFIGSRMHSCISAMSQCIPTVGVAYSRKFEGVFGSIGLADCVADARNCDEKELLARIESVFERKEQIREHLENIIPKVKEDVLNIFKT